MNHKRTFSKEEISKILARASKIQTRKDLYGNEQGLTEDELVHIAEEVGIDKESLIEAIHSADIPELNSTFKWFQSSSKIQDIETVDGEITEESWGEIVNDIRRITKGLGNISKVSKSFEWEDRINEVGYKHLTLTPVNGKTEIQYVSTWSALEFILTIIPFFIGAGFAGILLDGISLPGIFYFLFPLLGGLAGVGAARVFLNNYFEKQKNQFKKIVKSIGKRLGKSTEPDIILEDREASGEESTSVSSKAHRERS